MQTNRDARKLKVASLTPHFKPDSFPFLSLSLHLPPVYTHIHTQTQTFLPRPSFSSPTWEPPTRKSDEPQTWSSLSWSHNCSSLVNDRLCNLIPHTYAYTHATPPPPPTHTHRLSQGFRAFLSLHSHIVPTQTASCFWQPNYWAH